MFMTNGQSPPRSGNAPHSMGGMNMGGLGQASMSGAPGQIAQNNMPMVAGAGAGPRPLGITAEQRAMRLHPDNVKKATMAIERVKQQWLTNNEFGKQPPIQIAEHEVVKYAETFNRLLALVEQVDTDLARFICLLNGEQFLPKVIMMIGQTRYQRQYAAQGRYILDLNKMRLFIQHLTNMLAGAGMPIRSVPRDGVPVPAAPGGVPPLGAPFTQHPAQTQGQPSQQIQHPPPSNATAPSRQAAAPKAGHKKTSSVAQASSAAASGSASSPTPPPAPSASSPPAQAPTPSVPAPSPQTPKSPKVSTKPKPKPIPRRKSLKAAAAAPTQPSEPLANATTPQNAPTPSASASTPSESSKKRAREEDSNATTEASSSVPSPKRSKSEWEGPPSDEQKRRQEEADGIQTGDDAKVLEEINAVLDACAPTSSYDMDSALNFGAGPSAGSSLLSEPLSPTDPLGEFFDFSSYAIDEDAAKAPPTPDLIPGSTNPSPESGSEPEGAAHGTMSSPMLGGDAHAKMGGGMINGGMGMGNEYGEDPLHVGVWQEIDGGEAPYYQGSAWKWDGAMPTSDQPWAISTS
ncbi:hypothetical protein OF83DRAFT_623924 [Amylostereum chailletii]|nr:hypothetical protein OF83DRAFT_623924 [Amylostereum chailletii]